METQSSGECQVCGATCESADGLCSSACALAYGRKQRWAGHTTPEKQCSYCGKSFAVGPKAGRDYRATVCSPECHRKIQAQKVTVPLIERKCLICDVMFLVGGVTGKPLKTQYCSREHASIARYQRGKVCKELSVAHAAYLAGFWDGEGSIMLHRKPSNKQIGMRITVANTVKTSILWIMEQTGIGTLYWRPSRTAKHKPSYWWQSGGDTALQLLKQMRPYLLIKAEQADLAIDFQERMKIPALHADQSWKVEYFFRMKALNAKGPAVITVPEEALA